MGACELESSMSAEMVANVARTTAVRFFDRWLVCEMQWSTESVPCIECTQVDSVKMPADDKARVWVVSPIRMLSLEKSVDAAKDRLENKAKTTNARSFFI